MQLPEMRCCKALNAFLLASVKVIKQVNQRVDGFVPYMGTVFNGRFEMKRGIRARLDGGWAGMILKRWEPILPPWIEEDEGAGGPIKKEV